jgi:hypothetical protein
MRMCHMCKFYIAAGRRSGMGCMGGSMMGMMGTAPANSSRAGLARWAIADLYAPL